MSDYFDYMELKRFAYKLYKDGVWDGLSKDIKRLYWRDLQRLWRRVKAGMGVNDIDDRESEDTARILGITPDIAQSDKCDEDSKPSGKAKKCSKYQRPLSLERAEEELGFLPLSSFSVESYVIQKELYQAVYVAIENLESEQKQIIFSYYFEGKTQKQIGAELDVCQKTVSNKKKEVIEQLQELLKDFR